jgi:hypothetical protein
MAEGRNSTGRGRGRRRRTSSRLRVEVLNASIADKISERYLRTGNTVGTLELERNAPIGRYAIDCLAKKRNQAHQVQDIRRVFSDAATYASFLHSGDQRRHDREAKAREYLESARCLEPVLRSFLKHDSEKVYDGLGVLGLIDVDLKHMNEAAQYLCYLIDKLPMVPSRSGGARSLRFGEAYAGFAAFFWRESFGEMPPKSRTGWFVEFLVDSWADLGLPSDWQGLEDFYCWMGERAVAGVGRYSRVMTPDEIQLEIAPVKKRRNSPDRESA